MTTTVEDVLQPAKDPAFIHSVSVDTESAEYEILRAFRFSEYWVGAFAIEHNNEEPKRTEIRELLEANRCRFVKSQLLDELCLRR